MEMGCETPEHTVCVPTAAGQHQELSEEAFAAWFSLGVHHTTTECWTLDGKSVP
jgi:hypothetical protein